MTASGCDRAASGHYSLTVTDRQVHLHDHGQRAWFAFHVQAA
ncbi:hypothetical protein [Sphingomonas sp. SRS2]|nr:hypothetical protein [Sphingomonas sp. SRS2]